MKVSDFEKYIEEIAPLRLQEAWDNSGWQLKLKNGEFFKILIGMEVTSQVVSEAIELRADLILTHHPLIFTPLKMIDQKYVTGNLIKRLIENNISVYSVHTNFDIVEKGNNDYIGELLGFENIGLMDGDETEICRVGMVSSGSIMLEDLISWAEERIGVSRKFFSLVGDKTKYIKKVGWCSGAGGDFIELAHKNQCDLYITGDVKYHGAQLAKELNLAVLDLGHFGTEYLFTENMYELLNEKLDKFKEVDIIKSCVNLNPFTEI